MNELLEKYWNGTTSLHEEQELKSYFNSNRVVPEHEIYRNLFNTLDKAPQDEIIPEFNAFAKVNKQKINSTRFHKRSPLVKMMATAAVVAGVALIGAYFNTNDDNLGTYDDPQEAYQATVNALQMIGTNFNNGKKKLQPLNDINHKTQQVFSLTY